MSAIKELNWLDISDDQKSRVVAELKDWHQTQIQDFVTVIRGQHEGEDNDWWDIFCVEDDSHHEVFHGTIWEFATKLVSKGWAVDSIERFTALCPACVNYESPVSEREAWEDEKVYEMRKGE